MTSQLLPPRRGHGHGPRRCPRVLPERQLISPHPPPRFGFGGLFHRGWSGPVRRRVGIVGRDIDWRIGLGIAGRFGSRWFAPAAGVTSRPADHVNAGQFKALPKQLSFASHVIWRYVHGVFPGKRAVFIVTGIIFRSRL